jgi:hypothetical protein
MEQVLLSPIPLQILKNELTEIVRAEISKKQREDVEEKLLSPAETCKLFQPSISKVTLAKWAKEGRLTEHRIGGRVYFRYSEVLASLQTLKKYKRFGEAA